MLKRFAIALASALLAVLPLSGLAHAADGTNLIANPSMETGAPDGWTANVYGDLATATTQTLETTGHTGKSLKTTVGTYTASATDPGDANWSFAPVAVTAGTNYQYTHWYKSDVATEIDLATTYASAATLPAGCDTATLSCYDNLLTVPASATWTQIKVTFVAPAGATTATVFQPLNKTGYVQIDDADLHSYTPTGFSQAMVSLTFDDGWLDQYTNGRPVLNQYGIPSTYYLLTGTVTDPAYMTTANMQTLGTDPVGNELASHTIHHCSLSSTANHTDDPANCPMPLTTAQMDGELGGAQTQLRSWFPSIASVANNFATPYGEYDTNSLTEIKKYYRSHRSTETGYNTKDNFDRYNIKVQNITDATTPAQVQAWVDQAIKDKSWLVIVYHRVMPTDPTPTAEDYSVTPANLATEAQYIQSKVAAGTIAAKTVEQALNALEPQVGAMPLPGSTGTTPPPAGKVGDVTADGIVDSRDATVMFANWGKTGAGVIGDVTGDGVVDSRDATVMFANWSK